MGIGRAIIYMGLAIVLIGYLNSLGERLPLRYGRLPGDIVYRGKNSVFYFPLTTSILLSVVLSLVFWLFGRK